MSMIGKIKEWSKKTQDKADAETIKSIKQYPRRFKWLTIWIIAMYLIIALILVYIGAYLLVIMAVLVTIWVYNELNKVYKKVLNKSLFSLGILLIIAISSMVAGASTDLATIEYADTDIFVATGNVTLEYDSSDTGDEDVILIWRIYSHDSNMTVYCVKSQEIMYDHTFVNNTKDYTFYDNKTDKYYVIKVDYSGIRVPRGQEEILNETIMEKDEIIDNLTAENTEMKADILLKNNTIAILTGERDTYKQERDDELAVTDPLRMDVDHWRNRSMNFSGDKNDLEEDKRNMNETIANKDYLIGQKEDMWCFDFKAPSFLIGISLFGLVIGGQYLKKNYKPKDANKKQDSRVDHVKKTTPDKLMDMKAKEKEIEAVIAEKNQKKEEDEKEEEVTDFEPVENDDKKEPTDIKPSKTPVPTAELYNFVDNYKKEPGVEIA